MFLLAQAHGNISLSYNVEMENVCRGIKGENSVTLNE